tara:strand:- start:9810 stop:10820 length:1011 start_codon:yes stop_codon:yes gene_type:complete
MSNKKRILTGIRPTGALHLGHYAGALETWLEFQDSYECFFLIADYQALGDNFDDIGKITDSVRQVTIDWLSVGLDPSKSNFVIQSYVPEHAELTMLLSFVTPLGMLERNPTLKGELDQLSVEKRTVGFYNYPMSQVADILLPRADLVPVGEDQAPHIEMTREVVRKFNRIFEPIFKEPGTKIGRVPRLKGIDGNNKMSKSKGNVIELRFSEEQVNKAVMSMYTDPKRLKATDPGTVEGNPLFQYHDAFNIDKEKVEDFKKRYKEGKVGDVEVKKDLAQSLNKLLSPFREKREYYENNPKEVEDALLSGTNKAREIASETMKMVRAAMKIDSYTSKW